MTKLHHFHPARKGSGSLRPFPIYPLYTQTVILSLDKPIADCFKKNPSISIKFSRNTPKTSVTAKEKHFAQNALKRQKYLSRVRHLTLSGRIAHNGSHAETRCITVPPYRVRIRSAVYRHFSYRIETVSAENVERRTEAKSEPKDNSLTHNGCAPAARVRCAQAPRARRHAQPRYDTSLRTDGSHGSFRSQQQDAEKHISCFYTLDCSMRLAARCRSLALSTASICR